MLVDVVDNPAAPGVDLWVGFEDAAHAALVNAVLSAFNESARLVARGRRRFGKSAARMRG
jgi:hypothetical protein